MKNFQTIGHSLGSNFNQREDDSLIVKENNGVKVSKMSNMAKEHKKALYATM